MDTTYLWVKYAHILGAVLIFGTGLGTAFQMVAVHVRGDVRGIAVVAHNVVLADWLFTTPSVILQPITGAVLAYLAGYPPTSGWIVVSVGLYALAGACWLPVVWLQVRMAQLARDAVRTGNPLPPAYHRMARWWFALGWPAFLSLLVVFHLMLFKPELW